MKRPATPSLFSECDPSGDARDELNFAEFPIAMLSARASDGVSKLVFEDTMRDHGAGATVTRRLTVRAHEDYGLATPVDEEVLLGLVALTKAKNNLAAPRVTFTRYELVQLLGWQLNGGSYERLVGSLKRWANLSLDYENAWWDNENKSWADVAFHVLNTVVINKPARGTHAGLVHVEWNEVVFKSFQAGYLKQIDLAFYRGLESAVSRRLYRFLDKHFYHRARLEYDLLTLAFEKVGLSRDYEPWKVKQKLAPAIAELEARGYLQRLSPKERYLAAGKGKWRAVFERARQRATLPPAAEELPVPATPQPVVKLTDRGVSEKTARALVAAQPAERVEAQIEAFDWLVSKKDKRVSRSPAGYLVKAIEEDFALPAGFQPEALKRQRAEENRKRAAEESQRRRAEEERVKAGFATQQKTVDDFLAALPEDDRERFVAEAVAAADRFVAERYAEAQRNGQQVAAARYLNIILEPAIARAGDPIPAAS